MGETSIEWTNRSVNPFLARAEGSTATKGGYKSGVGHYCEKISPGCANCYSSASQPRFGLPVFQEQRRGGIETFLHAPRLLEVLRRREATKWFWCDMTDMFGRWVPNEWIAACFAVMAATPQHTHQLLTKRADRLPEWFAWLDRTARNANVDGTTNGAVCLHHLQRETGDDGRFADHELVDRVAWAPWPLPNVHLGVSVENADYRHRIDDLLRTPAAVRWVSLEPLLGPVDAGEPLSGEYSPHDYGGTMAEQSGPTLDWVVVGGESGPRARPFDINWARSIVNECKAADVPVFVKQLGSVPVMHEADWRGPGGGQLLTPRNHRRAPEGTVPLAMNDRKGGDPREWPADLRVREFPVVRR